ncbi:MAG: hypothetical protein AAB731_00585, partial [Patescibacteria group bacterium]
GMATGTVVAPNDETIYLVDSASQSCQATAVGCEFVGNPQINKTERITISKGFSVANCNNLGGVMSADGKSCVATITAGGFTVAGCDDSHSYAAGVLTYNTTGVLAESCQFDIIPTFTEDMCVAANGSPSADGKTCLINTGDQIGNFATSAYKDDYITNNPDNYRETLCEARGVGCEEYKAKSELLYFKEPNERVCEYRESVNYGAETVNGWFKRGTDEPCEPSFKSGLVYGIYRNGDPQYNRWGGVCKPEFSGCIEFVDPVDTTSFTGEPKGYYYLDNDKIDRASCRGQVSPKEGCVLFDQTNVVVKNYSASTTYLKGESAGNQLVAPASGPTTKVCQQQSTSLCKVRGGITTCPPVKMAVPYKECNSNSECRPSSPPMTCTGTSIKICNPSFKYTCAPVANDTNTILKVRRDRECAEWLDCRNTTKVYDSLNNKYKNICTSLDVCNSYIKQGEATRCNNFIESDVRDENDNPAVLTEAIYSGRDVRWGGKEYSGYSIPNKYSVTDLKTVSF